MRSWSAFHALACASVDLGVRTGRPSWFNKNWAVEFTRDGDLLIAWRVEWSVDPDTQQQVMTARYPWTPSHDDMFATDWVLPEGTEVELIEGTGLCLFHEVVHNGGRIELDGWPAGMHAEAWLDSPLGRIVRLALPPKDGIVGFRPFPWDAKQLYWGRGRVLPVPEAAAGE